MDRIREKAFLATTGALVGLEFASVLLHRLPLARGFSPLGWTGMVRFADLILFLAFFRILSVPLSAAGLRRFVKGSLIGLVVSIILGSGFLLVLYSSRVLWGVDLRVFVNPGARVKGFFPLAVLCLLGPFVEEIFFRGLCYTLIRAHRGIWVSVALSTLLFGVSHLLSAGALGVTFVPLVGGILFALLYEFTRTLFTPFVVHAVGNLILFSRVI